MNLVDFIFPNKCLECGTSGKYICQSCIKKVPNGGWFGSNLSLFRYIGVIRKAIISLKYKFAYDIASELSDICTQKLKINYPLKDIVLVPIPLHRLRQNWRGFNQAEIIGEKIAKKMKWKFIPNLLIRNINTKSQVGLSKSERLQNLSNVFNINPKLVQNHKYPILIFDDVYTTGSTITEAARILKKMGFGKIYSLTIAR